MLARLYIRSQDHLNLPPITFVMYTRLLGGVCAQVDQIGQQECAQLFTYLARNVPAQVWGAGNAAEDGAFLRALPIFPAMQPGRRVCLDKTAPAPAYCPPDVLQGIAAGIAELPEALQVLAAACCACYMHGLGI